MPTTWRSTRDGYGETNGRIDEPKINAYVQKTFVDTAMKALPHNGRMWKRKGDMNYTATIHNKTAVTSRERDRNIVMTQTYKNKLFRNQLIAADRSFYGSYISSWHFSIIIVEISDVSQSRASASVPRLGDKAVGKLAPRDREPSLTAL